MKRLFSLTIMIAICVLLSSCAQNNGVAAPAASTTTAATSEVTTTEAATTSTAEFVTANESSLKFGDEYDVRKLKWRMSPDEVRTNEELSLTDEGTKEIFGEDVNVLSSDDAEIFGHKAKMQLCFYPEDVGLAEVMYSIQTDDLVGLYEELFDKAVGEFGSTEDDEWNRSMPASTWEIDDGKTQLLIGYSEDDDFVECLFSAIGISYPHHWFEMPERPEYDPTSVTSEPIDKTLDCEQIMLDKANKLHEMISGWCNVDKSKLAFEVGDQCESFQGYDGAYKVVSDNVKTYADFKALYENDIYGAYINTLTWEYLIDIDGVLHYIKPMCGLLGTYETWYIGCDVTDDAIVGRFAILCWGDEDNETQNADYLNDISHYKFYDIKVQNVDGKYVITSCGDESDIILGSVFDHGLYYNSEVADRSLITNEAVKPKN